MGYGIATTRTEHSGAKKGKGAFWGRKADAKLTARKGRRAADKATAKNRD